MVAKIAAQLHPGRSASMTTPAATPMSTSPTSSPPRCRIRCRASPAWATSRCSARQYAMRIWLDPYKLHNYALMPSDVSQRHPGAERPGLRRPDRRPARRAGPGAQRHRHRPVAAADPGAVPQHHPQDHPPAARWCGCAMSRASSWARTPTPSPACSTAMPAAGIAILLAPGANALKHRGCGQGAGPKHCAPSLPPGHEDELPGRQHRPSSASRSARWWSP